MGGDAVSVRPLGNGTRNLTLFVESFAAPSGVNQGPRRVPDPARRAAIFLARALPIHEPRFLRRDCEAVYSVPELLRVLNGVKLLIGLRHPGTGSAKQANSQRNASTKRSACFGCTGFRSGCSVFKVIVKVSSAVRAIVLRACVLPNTVARSSRPIASSVIVVSEMKP